MSDDELTVMQLKYHEVTLLNTIKAPVVCSCIVTAFTALSVKYKTAYLIYEGLHFAIGLLVFLGFASSTDVLFGLLILIVFSARLIIYILAMELHKKKHSS